MIQINASDKCITQMHKINNSNKWFKQIIQINTSHKHMTYIHQDLPSQEQQHPPEQTHSSNTPRRLPHPPSRHPPLLLHLLPYWWQNCFAYSQKTPAQTPQQPQIYEREDILNSQSAANWKIKVISGVIWSLPSFYLVNFWCLSWFIFRSQNLKSSRESFDVFLESRGQFCLQSVILSCHISMSSERHFM